MFIKWKRNQYGLIALFSQGVDPAGRQREDISSNCETFR